MCLQWVITSLGHSSISQYFVSSCTGLLSKQAFMRGVMKGLSRDRRQVLILSTDSSGRTTSRISFMIFLIFLACLSMGWVSWECSYFPRMRMKVLV